MNTMEVTNLVDNQKRVASAAVPVEDKIRELVRKELPREASGHNPDNEVSVDTIGALLRKVGSASISGMEKLISELEEARSFLKNEGERIQREAARYASLTQTADASVKIISESLRDWRTAGEAGNSKAA
jgi:hypothetical protein